MHSSGRMAKRDHWDHLHLSLALPQIQLQVRPELLILLGKTIPKCRATLSFPNRDCPSSPCIQAKGFSNSCMGKKEDLNVVQNVSLSLLQSARPLVLMTKPSLWGLRVTLLLHRAAGALPPLTSGVISRDSNNTGQGMPSHAMHQCA